MNQIKSISISQKNEDFSFQNVQPINYLKTFNKMLEYMKPPSQSSQTARQLKTVKLSKFPLHSYYQKMQGILQGNNKKQNQNQKHNKKDAEFQQLEQKFLNKHYTFVKGALSKIILDNEAQQNLLVKAKNFYQSNQAKRIGVEYQNEIIRLVKFRSQPKLRSIKNTIDSARKTVQQNNLNTENYNSARTLKNSFIKSHIKHESERSSKSNKKMNRKGMIIQQNAKDIKTQYSSVNKDQSKVNKRNRLQQQNNQQDHNPIFKKLQAPHKNDKYRKRKFDQIDALLSARKTFLQGKWKNQIREHKVPLTQRKHYQSTLQQKNINQMKNSLNSKNSFNQTKYSNQKRKDNQNALRQLQYNDQQQIQMNEQYINELKKQIGLSKRKNKISESIQNESMNDQFGDQDQNFFKQVQYLQNHQTKIQNQFASAVEDKIKLAKLKLNSRLKQVKQFNYQSPKQNTNVNESKKSKS